MQAPLLREVLRLGAIYPQPRCPSLRHGLAEASALDESLDDEALIAAISEALAKRGLSGRIAGYECEPGCYDDGETLYDNVICYAVMPEVF